MERWKELESGLKNSGSQPLEAAFLYHLAMLSARDLLSSHPKAACVFYAVLKGILDLNPNSSFKLGDGRVGLSLASLQKQHLLLSLPINPSQPCAFTPKAFCLRVGFA